MFSKITITALVAVATAETELAKTFAQYVAQYGKNYATIEEYQFRYIQFAKNYTQVLLFNLEPGQTSTVGLNKFSDWTEAEMKKIRNYKPRKGIVNAVEVELSTNDLPTEINWVTAGAVNPV